MFIEALMSRFVAFAMIFLFVAVSACNVFTHVKHSGVKVLGPERSSGDNRTNLTDVTKNGPLTDRHPKYFDKNTGLSVIFATPDLAIGIHRVALAFSNENGLIKLPIARIESYYYMNGPNTYPEGPVETVKARYFEFPLGHRGLYVSHLNFTQKGIWGIKVSVPNNAGGREGLLFTFEVNQNTTAPDIGDPIPATRNRTVNDVSSLKQLTTSNNPDEFLYQKTVKDVLDSGMPLVLTFSSPAFCTSALCGPQVEVLSSLRKKHMGTVEFLHIDLYENPNEIQGDLSLAVRTPILDQWRVESDEWTFVVDREGRVVARFEGFVGELELGEVLSLSFGL